ncbi:MAG: hypothetical protein LBT59_05800 [Clostridiales bacterium]|jgi:hypothetical protein|nr:hypothetical protein [Clostridiales bacterium]
MKAKVAAFAFAIAFSLFLAVNAFAWAQSKGTLSPASLLAGKAKIDISILDQGGDLAIRSGELSDSWVTARVSNGLPYDSDLSQRPTMIAKIDFTLSVKDADTNLLQSLLDSETLSVAVEPVLEVTQPEAQLPEFENGLRSYSTWLQDTATHEFYCVLSPGESADVSIHISSEGAEYEEFASILTSWNDAFPVAGPSETSLFTLSHELLMKISAQGTVYEPTAIDAEFGDILKRLALVSIQ